MTRLPALLLPLLALAAAGCGVGPGEELAGGVELRVTRDFGHEELTSLDRDSVTEGETVMRLLQSEHDVDTAYGGGFVQAIDGLEGEGADGTSDWFYFVNGAEGGTGAADREVAPGDVIQWDYRDWSAAMSVPAIVGAFPEPFLHGLEGERFPTRIECARPDSTACTTVDERLAEADVTAGKASLGTAAGPSVLRVVVGTWDALRELPSVRALRGGPEESGVYARFAQDGALELLDERGEVVREAAPGTGLVAALPQEEGGQQPAWIVTGVDEGGVEAAAAALDEEALRNRYAVAAGPDGAVPLPLVR